jgi:hypothetical protein
MDIEFIICWSDHSWTTETDRIDNPPLDGNDGLCYDTLCHDKLTRISADLKSADDIMKCPRGAVVHVGIYHIGEVDEGS